ncbi:MAG: ribosomal protein S18-alanine N-acetyltransferase [Firmicutes bacterium]|nr:ribosomal protein S18-alanine N-acetyltransferase [Bacillota bacterium]
MIRIATPDDAAAIAAIETESFTHHPWTLEMFQAALADPLYSFYADERDGNIVGFGCIKHAGLEAEIEYIAVAEAFRRQGIADQLLNALRSDAGAKGTRTVFLEVGALNAPAIALYEKHGFERISVRKNYYGEGRDAVIMKK